MTNQFGNSSIKGIAFDWGGVICEDPAPGFLRQLASSLKCSVEDLVPYYFASIDGFQRGVVSESAFLSQVADGVNCTPLTKPFWKQALKAVYREQEDVIVLIHSLKRRGYAVGLLSNTEIPARDFHLECGYDFFDARVFSCEEGIAKPEREIYDLMARRLNVANHELLFIDDKQENVDGAIAAGVCGVLFKGYADLVDQLGRYGVLVDESLC